MDMLPVQRRGVPRVAIVVLTYRCNSKCTMCSIWEDKHAKDLPSDVLRRTFSEPLVQQNLRSVNLTGGELFLRSDIPQIYDMLVESCPSLESITINSNATLPERMFRAFKEILGKQREAARKIKTLCYISLDGSEAVHDRVRGVPGGYRKVLNFIKGMKPFQEAGEIELGLNFTITKDNFNEMGHVYQVARDLGVEISYTLAMTSTMYFKNEGLSFDLRAETDAERTCVSSFLREKVSSRDLPDPANFYKTLIGMLEGKPRAVGCIFKEDGFFLDPSGNVYPCWGHEHKIGNINDTSLTELWDGESSADVRSGIDESCKTCPNNCYIRYQRYDRVKSLFDNGAARFKRLEATGSQA